MNQKVFACCLLMADMERSQPDFSNSESAAGSIDQLRDRIEQEFRSSACKRQRVEQKSDKSPMEYQLTEENSMIRSKNGDVCLKQLCNLPDELLLQILSSLPLKDAVKTSILSKRWKHLWTLVPDLHFDQFDFSENHKLLFWPFVEQASARLGSSGHFMRSLSLIGQRDITGATRRIMKLVTTIVTARSVQNLFLWLPKCRNAYVFASSIFECEALEILEVQSRCIITLPNSIRLSNLKVLILRLVTFKDDYSVEKLCSSPLLERLELHCCSWMEGKRIHIFAPKLKFLDISFEFSEKDLTYDRQVRINTDCLKSFSCACNYTYDYRILGGIKQLVEAKLIYCACPGVANLVVERNFQLLSLFSKVKELTLSGDLLQDLARWDKVPPLFSNSTKLTLTGFIESRIAMKGLFAVLRRCPQLRSLSFHTGFYHGVSVVRELLDPVPSCFLTELKEVSFVDRCWNQNYLKTLSIMEILLEMAVVLEELTVDFQETIMKKEILLDYLGKFPKWLQSYRIFPPTPLPPPWWRPPGWRNPDTSVGLRFHKSPL